MSRISDLSHVRKGFAGGGEVYVLDTGAIIGPEAEAMLQALHSRSTGGFLEHLKAVEKRGPERFMRDTYVGYGHKSIGDCGSTTLFIEGVSMLAAKAIQDHPLYSGQESSTRYIDFSKQRFIDPTNTNEGREIMESIRRFYISSLEPTIEMLAGMYFREGGEKEKDYEKAIKARALDIVRGLLPAGASTNLAWHSNLRQISDRLSPLRHHPLAEVGDASIGMEEACLEAHPNSFSNKRYPEAEAYQELASEYYYYDCSDVPVEMAIDSKVDIEGLRNYWPLFDERPPKSELPKHLGQLGIVEAEFPLDFGSFRDLQRHRALNQRMPLLTTNLGFGKWYLDNLPKGRVSETEDFLGNLERRVENLGASPYEVQYFTPIGYDIPNKITGDLPATTYMVELRSTRFVHPTLRKKAIDIGRYLEDELSIPIHWDPEPDRFDVKRGQQDIIIQS